MAQFSRFMRITNKDLIMPESNLDTLYRYLTGAVAIVASYAAIVHAWYNSRFKVVNKRIDKVVDEQEKTRDKVSDHDSRLSAFEVHIENATQQRTEIKDGIEKIHDKLDKMSNG